MQALKNNYNCLNRPRSPSSAPLNPNIPKADQQILLNLISDILQSQSMGDELEGQSHAPSPLTLHQPQMAIVNGPSGPGGGVKEGMDSTEQPQSAVPHPPLSAL
ncbi:hypothetical protein C0995_014796 [Termitomyces sp. Mi166|nr:hypothetical protein C0995_014796 [Termitomyces sp. Mi166\